MLHLKKITNPIFALLLLTLYVTHAQPSLPRNAGTLIDDALSRLGMNRKDCSMRGDMVKRDPFRLGIVDAAFANPFSVFSISKNYSETVKDFNVDNSGILFDRIMKDMEFGKFRRKEFPDTLQLESIIKRIRTKEGNEINLADIPSNIILPIGKLYISPIVEAYKQIQLARGHVLKSQIIMSQCDSLLMMSEEDSHSNPFEMYYNELHSDSVAKLYFDECTFVDLHQLYEQSLMLYMQIGSAAVNAQYNNDVVENLKQTFFIETTYGTIVIGGRGNDIYKDDYLFIIDLGGNDSYYSSLTKQGAISKPVRVIVDVGGDDVYIGSDYALSSGVIGCSLILDLKGDDTYKSGSFSLGSGLFGVGILHDFSGSDIYSGKVFSQGAGAFGIGLLIDNDGNDSYVVQANGQGFGYVKGMGMLIDNKGNDIYTTSSPFVDVLRYDSHFVSFTQGASLGQRPIASGGLGILADAYGNDTYSSDIYGQGTAYWFGIGILNDMSGEDRYQSYQYAQGAGIHFAHGLLRDSSGDDIYISHGVSQGCGHDVGVGILLDDTGDDSYVAESLSLGGGNANAVSIFIDCEGNDSYIARNTTNTFGYSDFRRSFGMIGIFSDGAGKDLYGDTIKNNSNNLKSTFGVFNDSEIFSSTKEEKNIDNKESKSVFNLPILRIDSLFMLASTAPQKYQYLVNPARDEIVKRGKVVYEFLSGKFKTGFPRQRLALEYIIPKVYTIDSTFDKVIVDSLESNDYATLMFSLWSIGKCKIKGAEEKFNKLLKNSDWRIRAAVVQQIGESSYKENLNGVIQTLTDSIANVRARAAYTISMLNPENVTDILRNAVNDKTQLVRNSAIMGFKSNVIQSDLFYSLLSKCTSNVARHSVVRLLPMIDTSQINESFIRSYKKIDNDVRRTGYMVLKEKYPNYTYPFNIVQLLENEEDVDVRSGCLPEKIILPVSIIANTSKSPAKKKLNR